jgi:hypothetical protein
VRWSCESSDHPEEARDWSNIDKWQFNLKTRTLRGTARGPRPNWTRHLNKQMLRRRSMEVSGQLHVPAALLRGKAIGTHWTGGWVGPRAGVDTVANRKLPSPCQESNPDRPARSVLKIAHDGDAVSVRPHVSVMKMLDEFLLNVIMEVYTKICRTNLILVRVDEV